MSETSFPTATTSLPDKLDTGDTTINHSENPKVNAKSSTSPEQQEEHPDAARIRRQVEYYFSDENLPSDLHLLQCCGGRENLPVSISRIRGFKKMRQFKDKKMVVEALRKSPLLDVTEDGKGVKRKTPLAAPNLLDPDYKTPGQEDDEIAYDPRSKRPVHHPVPLLPQKKKELPPGVTKGMLKPTGFEDTYVEGPLAPEEAEQEELMYDPDKPFVERIELAIQRFRSKRRMHEMYSKIFGKWMKFGGVEHETRMFGGLSREELATMTGEEIARVTAVFSVPWDRMDTDKWVVDFVGVAESFFSSFYPNYYGYAPNQVKTACQVLRSFFQYLLFHRVCPEYDDQLHIARGLCDKAETELPKVDRAGLTLPGDFNMAASTIFDGHHAETYAGNAEWTQDMPEEERKSFEALGMRKEKAMITFKTAVAIYGTDEQFELLTNAGASLRTLETEKSEELNLVVIRTEPCTTENLRYYNDQNEHYKGKVQLNPLGKLICKTVDLEDNSAAWDLPKGVVPPAISAPGTDFEFWVEDDVLDKCFEGMKLAAIVNIVTGGFVILDQVKAVMCSFYKWIPNELWMARQGPKELRIIKKGLLELEEDKGREENDGDQTQLEEGEMSDDFDEDE